MTKLHSSSTIDRMTGLQEYLMLEGWELLEPLERDHGQLYRARRGQSVVQAATIPELCRRIADIERGTVNPPQPVTNS